MRTGLLILVFLTVFFPAICQQECRSSEYKEEMIAHTPGLASRMDAIESFIQNFLQSSKTAVNGNPTATTSTGLNVITIPVVVHILYNSSSQNISDAQVHSQLDVLNKDFRRLNVDTSRTPAVFKQFAADPGFQFELARTDPNGYASTGIIRKHTAIQAFNIDDAIKYSAKGGDDAWDCNNYLNIWVANLTSGILGYSSVVGGPKATDGITVQYTAFGTMGTATAPFNEGRTATHELGHWLDLIHTWGDADCGDDHVADTPPQKAPNYGCPGAIKITCGSGPYGDMYMNYMDFTNDDCMNLFTNGQTERMRALFAAGGPRYPLLSTPVLTETPLPDTTSSNSTPEGAGPALSLYPNPASSIVYVQVGAPITTGLTLEIYSSMGQLVLTVGVNQSVQPINISMLGPGMYYVMRRDGNNKSVAKMIKL
jgi:Pregnancy-associated plasma protein-A/Secretion system C-terminal sorting domain